jgi:hypothetical protein
MAFFCRGFVYECDIPQHGMLTIEGATVDGFERTQDGVRVRLPDSGEVITAPGVEALVLDYVTRTGAFAAREEATREHLDRLGHGKDAWNEWRRKNPSIQPMLAAVKASQLKSTTFDDYNFSYTNFTEAVLPNLSFRRANFHQAILAKADLSGAHLQKANFCRTDLYMTDFTGAHMQGANLQGVQLAQTIFLNAEIDGCTVYGLSAWDLKLNQDTQQSNLVIRYRQAGEKEEKTALVDGLDLASFVYLTLCNENIARIIDAASRKWVLILGRFTQGREVLDAVADSVKQEGKIPVIFDFSRPEHRDLIETVLLLAGMSAFVIVDISDPKSTPLELYAIATNYGVPIFPIVAATSDAFSLFAPLRRFRWVFPPMSYKDTRDLVTRLPAEVFQPAQAERDRLASLKRAVEERVPPA